MDIDFKLEFADLPPSKDSKSKIRKSFNLSQKALDIYEKLSSHKIDSSFFVQNSIEKALIAAEMALDKKIASENKEAN